MTKFPPGHGLRADGGAAAARQPRYAVTIVKTCVDFLVNPEQVSGRGRTLAQSLAFLVNFVMISAQKTSGHHYSADLPL